MDSDHPQRWPTLYIPHGGGPCFFMEPPPGALSNHPTPEHLVPLLVAAGAAGSDIGRHSYAGILLTKPISAFQFG